MFFQSTNILYLLFISALKAPLKSQISCLSPLLVNLQHESFVCLWLQTKAVTQDFCQSYSCHSLVMLWSAFCVSFGFGFSCFPSLFCSLFSPCRLRVWQRAWLVLALTLPDLASFPTNQSLHIKPVITPLLCQIISSCSVVTHVATSVTRYVFECVSPVILPVSSRVFSNSNNLIITKSSNLVRSVRARRDYSTSKLSCRFTTGIETPLILARLESWHQNLSLASATNVNAAGGCFIHTMTGLIYICMPYLAGAVVECVIVDRASLPVLDLQEAGTFGGAAVLQWLGGRCPALGRRLERADRHLDMSHYCCVWLTGSDLWDTFGARWTSC